MKENDNISVELDKAIEKVSAEIEKENKGEEVETAVATTEEEPKNDPTPKGEEPEAATTPFVPDDALTERAIRAGLSMKDVKGFSSAEFAESILSRLEAASKPNGEKEEPTGEESPAVKFDAVLEKMKEDVDEDGNPNYDPKFIEMFEGMAALLKSQREEIASLKKAGSSASERTFFEQQLGTLGEGVAKHLDAASKSKLEAKFRTLTKAYESAKVDMKPEDVFQEAAKLAIGDILGKTDAERKAAEAEKRRKMAIARPGGEQGQRKGGKAQSIDELVAEIAAELNN